MSRKYITEDQLSKSKLGPGARRAFDGILLSLWLTGCDKHTANLKAVIAYMREHNAGPLFAVKALLESGELKREFRPWTPEEDDE